MKLQDDFYIRKKKNAKQKSFRDIKSRVSQSVKSMLVIDLENVCDLS